MSRSRLEPVTAKVEEALVGPVARSQEEDQEKDGAVDAGSVEEVGADEEEEDEGGRGVGGNEEEGEPAARVSMRWERGERGEKYLRRQNMFVCYLDTMRRIV